MHSISFGPFYKSWVSGLESNFRKEILNVKSRDELIDKAQEALLKPTPELLTLVPQVVNKWIDLGEDLEGYDKLIPFLRTALNMKYPLVFEGLSFRVINLERDETLWIATFIGPDAQVDELTQTVLKIIREGGNGIQTLEKAYNEMMQRSKKSEAIMLTLGLSEINKLRNVTGNDDLARLLFYVVGVLIMITDSLMLIKDQRKPSDVLVFLLMEPKRDLFEQRLMDFLIELAFSSSDKARRTSPSIDLALDLLTSIYSSVTGSTVLAWRLFSGERLRDSLKICSKLLSMSLGLATKIVAENIEIIRKGALNVQ